MNSPKITFNDSSEIKIDLKPAKAVYFQKNFWSPNQQTWCLTANTVSRSCLPYVAGCCTTVMKIKKKNICWKIGTVSAKADWHEICHLKNSSFGFRSMTKGLCDLLPSFGCPSSFRLSVRHKLILKISSQTTSWLYSSLGRLLLTLNLMTLSIAQHHYSLYGVKHTCTQ